MQKQKIGNKTIDSRHKRKRDEKIVFSWFQNNKNKHHFRIE